MKRILLSACAILCIGAQAQTLTINGNIEFTPKYLTSDNEALMVTTEDNGTSVNINLYKDMELAKTFSVQATTVYNSSGTEYAESDPIYDSDGNYDLDPTHYTSLAWTRQEQMKASPEEKLSSFRFYDLNSNDNTGDMVIRLTQTLFNNDELWEYIVPRYETETTISNKVNIVAITNDGKFRFARSYSVSCYCTGFDIQSETGSTIVSLQMPEKNLQSYIPYIVRMGGKVFVVCEYYNRLTGISSTGIYQIDSATNSVKTISISNSKERFAYAKNGAITLQITEEYSDSKAVLTNMSGMAIATTEIPAGTTTAQLSTSSLPQGIYNVTLSKRGQAIKTEKVIVR